MRSVEVGFNRWQEIVAGYDYGNNDVVYKYRAWKTQYDRNWLFKPAIYLSSPTQFNDPYDAFNPPNFRDMDNMEVKDYLMHCAEELEKIKYPNAADRVGEIDELIRNGKFQEDVMSHYKIGHEMYGIACFSFAWNLHTQWAYYADNHRGVCIGYKTQRLFDQIPSWAGAVAYDTQFPRISPLDWGTSANTMTEQEKMMRAFCDTHFKHTDWSHEKEFRLVQFGREQREYELEFDSIAEVILGLKIESDIQKCIVDFCMERGILVYKLKQEDFNLNLSKEQIA